MRFTILSATIPLSRELRDSLREIHARFLEALANRVRAPGPERLARLVRRLVETASSQESEGAGGPAAGQRDAAPASGANSRELLAARAHFFLATDVAKLWLPGLEAAAACDLPSRRELSVLDLHAGLGTATAGIMLLLAASGYKGRVHSVLTEHDPASAGIARHVLDALAEVLPFRFQSSLSGASGPSGGAQDRFDLVLLFDPLATRRIPVDGREIRSRVVPLLREHVRKTGALILVDQAARPIAKAVAAAVTQVAAAGHPVLSPCPFAGDGAVDCPYASRSGRFCFHSQQVPLTPLVQSAAARSRMDRTEVNYTYLVATGSGTSRPLPDLPAEPVVGRVISHPSRVQKGYTYFVCTGRDVVQGFAPRFLADGVTRGGRLAHGTLVVLSERNE